MKKEPNMEPEENWLEVGKIVSPQGIKGEIRVNPQTDFPERFTKPGERWLSKNKEKPWKIKLLKGKQLPGKSIYVVNFENITNRAQAESLVGHKILIPSSHRPKLAKNEFHLLDLVGLEAKLSTEGPCIGKITDLKSAGNDLLEIQLLEGRKVLVPFVKEIVPQVNLNEGWITLNPPSGLLDL